MSMHPFVLFLSLASSAAVLLLRAATPAQPLPPLPPTPRGYEITGSCTIVVQDLGAARQWARNLAAQLPIPAEWTEAAALQAWMPIAAPALFEACPQLQQPEAWDAHPALAYQLLLGLAEGLRLHHKAPRIVVDYVFGSARAAMLERGWSADLLVPEAPEVS